MAAASLNMGLVVLRWLVLFLLFSSSLPDHVNVSVQSGGSATLPCVAAAGSAVEAVEWRRLDLGLDLLFLRANQPASLTEHPAYQGRVDLLDRQMKHGDVSLVLKNVTPDDSGTYKCSVHTKENTGMKPICNISLDVPSPGSKAGGNRNGSASSTPHWVPTVVAVGFGLAAAVGATVYF